MLKATPSTLCTLGSEDPMNNPLTPEDVRRIFDYEDGRLIWREDRGPRARAGQVAGHLRDGRGMPTHVMTVNAAKTTRARLVWAWHKGQWPKRLLTHMNGNTTDDHMENLSDSAPLERQH